MKGGNEKMIKLEKNFIGKVCETCDMLHTYTYKNLDDNGDIIVNVGCVNHDICYNTLEQAQKIKGRNNK